MIPILSNFYVFLGIILFLALVLGAQNYSSRVKMAMLLFGTLVLLCLEKPDWLMNMLRIM